ncbi:MAG: hypothetical protein LGR52_03635, partial [Candidatus Thiosymbion ectosymbiont of Robbea hypermnestra]|nr:hypothetical protein [Candidatus Thiosymbion ectosymbiont of Robbea hypermnestra]
MTDFALASPYSLRVSLRGRDGGIFDLWFPGFGVETSPHHHGCPQITPIFTDYRIFSSARIGV